jgi:hypothetical protein
MKLSGQRQLHNFGLLTIYYSNDDVKKDKMDSHTAHMGEVCIQSFCRKILRKNTTRKILRVGNMTS